MSNSIIVYIYINTNIDYINNLTKIAYYINNSGLINDVFQYKIFVKLNNKDKNTTINTIISILNNSNLNSMNILIYDTLNQKSVNEQIIMDSLSQQNINKSILYTHTNFNDNTKLEKNIYTNIVSYKSCLALLNKSNVCGFDLNKKTSFWWSTTSFLQTLNNNLNNTNNSKNLYLSINQSTNTTNIINTTYETSSTFPLITILQEIQPLIPPECEIVYAPEIPTWIYVVVIFSVIYLIIAWVLWLYNQN
jgi:hypothetical protein